MVCRCESPCRTGTRCGARRPDTVPAGELGEDLFSVAREYSALVHLAPALVGTPDSRLVRARRQYFRCGKRSGSRCPGAALLWRARVSREGAAADARRGRARHVVFFGALALFDARLAGRYGGPSALLSDERPRHGLRHHLLLGRPDDDDGPAFHARGAFPRRLYPCPRP